MTDDKPGPAQQPSADTIVGIMIREMFAPHELPLDEELTGKYQALAGKIVAALAPQSALEPSQAQISQLDDASNACLELAAKHGFATGHGDTVADMIREFSAQISKSPALEPVTVEAKHWRCFFCDEVFTDDKAAAHHFGGEICGEPLCKLAQVDGPLCPKGTNGSEQKGPAP